MGDFLDGLRLHGPSFWLGFLSAGLLWWLSGRLRPQFTALSRFLRSRSRAARLRSAAGAEMRYRSEVLRRAQRSHMAAALFPLDEILVTPRLLDPPLPVDPGALASIEDITTQALPYLPEWPELASAYRAPTLRLDEALQGGANLVITGWPGSGKTVALASLASRIVRQDPEIGELSSWTPFLVHILDFPLPIPGEQDPVELLIETTLQTAPSSDRTRLAGSLQSAVEAGRALLLLDGLDELPAENFRAASSYLARLVRKHPSLRVVTTASPDFTDGLASLGFLPFATAAWDDRQRQKFIDQWEARWVHATRVEGQATATDPLLIKEWLCNDPSFRSPLELTLQVWAAFAGDSLGGLSSQTIEAYLRRMTAGVPGARLALEKLAGQMALSEEAAVSPGTFETWIRPNEPGTDPASYLKEGKIVPALIQASLLRLLPGDRLAIHHPVIAGYLAGCCLKGEIGGTAPIDPGVRFSKEGGIRARLALEFLLVSGSASSALLGYLNKDSEPLHQNLLSAAHWLRDAPDSAWTASLLRSLAQLLQKEAGVTGLRARALAALATSNRPAAAVFFLQLLNGKDAALRQLAALGIGMVRDPKAVPDLERLLSDPAPNVRRAACLALVRQGSKAALDAVSDALLHGDDDLRRAAAEALANHPEEGHSLLKEGSRIDDLLVRRATIYGLQRVREAWAVEILEKMQVEDAQWVVTNAAGQALAEISRSRADSLRAHPPLNQTPWLIAFAGERGMGVPPGKAAVELLLLAMKEGDEDQRLAALDTAGRTAEARALPVIQDIFCSEKGDLREAAFTALWRLSAAGINV